MMHLIVMLLLSLTSQLALGSPLIFPGDDVNVNSKRLWTLEILENQHGVNESTQQEIITSGEVDAVLLSDKILFTDIPERNDNSEYEQRNDTEVLFLVEYNQTDLMTNESINISSNRDLNRKSMKISIDPDLEVPSKDNTGTTLQRNLKKRAADGKQIFFPGTSDQVDSSGPLPGSGSIRNSPMVGPCRDGDVRYQGHCSRLLSSKPCGNNLNWWLVLKPLKGHDFAECERRPCPLGQILYRNMCVDPQISTPCAAGQILYVEVTGDSFCDCEADYFYNIYDGTCVPEYDQGWCNWGQYLVRNDGGIPVCVPNPCQQNGYVYHEQNNFCYKKNYIGFCEQKNIQINENDAKCKDEGIDLRNIFEVPTLRRCPRGSLRDVLHECRRRFNVPSIPSVLKYQNFGSSCPPGYTRGPRGGCRKIINLFANGGRRS